MQKEFFFHPTIVVLESILTGLIQTGIILLWIILTFLWLNTSSLQAPLFRFFIFMTATLGITLYIITQIFKELKSTAYILTNEAILKKSPSKTTTIPYSEIRTLKYHDYPFGFKFVKIQSSGGSFILFFLIDNLSILIQDLTRNLLIWNQSSVFDSKNIEKCNQKAVISQYCNQFLFQSLRPLLSLVLCMIVLGPLTAFSIWQLSIFSSLLWSLFSIFYPIFSYILLYRLLIHTLSSKIKKGTSGFNLSGLHSLSSGIIRTLLACFIFYMTSGITFRSIYQ